MKKISFRRKTLLVASLLAVASVGVGVAGTVAFFQSSQSFDVTVQAAKVDVAQDATIEKPTLQYADVDSVTVAEDGSVVASGVVSGDTFIIHTTYKKNSTIGIKYRIKAKASTGLTTAIYTDADCKPPAKDDSYTNLAKGGKIDDHYVLVKVTEDMPNGGSSKVTVGVDAVQDNVTPVTEEEFTTSLANGGTLDLASDTNLTLDAASVVKNDTVVDLHGKTLTLDASTAKGTALSVEDGKTLTLKNGNVITKGKNAGVDLIQALGADLVLDNVNYTAENGTAIAYQGKGSHVTINNSNISVKNGYYAVTTNASSDYGDQSNSSVTITGSHLTVKNDGKEEEKGDCAALYLNVGRRYSISDSTITGQRFGALIRSGDLTLNNVTINKTETVDLGYVKKADSGTFSSGSEVAQGALFLGNGSNAGYTAPSKVTFAGPVTFEGVGPAIVASGSTTQDVDLETGKYYQGDVKVYDFRSTGDPHTFTINGNAVAIGTYDHAGKMTDEYTR